MFLIFHGLMKNEHGATAIGYAVIKLADFRRRHCHHEQRRHQDQCRAGQCREHNQVRVATPGANDRDALPKPGAVSGGGAGLVRTDASFSKRSAITSLFWWAASLFHFG